MSRRWDLRIRCAPLVLCVLLVCASASAVFSAPALAQSALTVDQFDRFVSNLPRKNDAKIARRIAAVRLTERVDATRIAKWQGLLPGDRSRKALMAVVDASAFAAPPSAEIPSQPAPDAETVKQILAGTWDYVRKALPRYPDFFADRTTTSFAFTTDSFLQPLDILGSRRPAPKPQFLHEVLGPGRSSDSLEPQLFYLGSRTEEVTYRGGTEVTNSPASANHPPATGIQINTNGEFGSILGLILSDFSTDQIAWSRWERGAGGLIAVFSYSVPSEKSHFAVTFTDEPPELPAYHGEIAIDPESGAIRSMKLFATTSGTDLFRESSMLVEFAPVEIGGKTYICPVHAVAMNRYFDTFEYANKARTPIPFATSTNDVMFTHYHQFRSHSHIVSGATAR